MTVNVETAPTESDSDSGSLGTAEDLPGKVNCLRSLKMNVLPSTPFYQRYHVSNLKCVWEPQPFPSAVLSGEWFRAPELGDRLEASLEL
jgi:hypothetical protein